MKNNILTALNLYFLFIIILFGNSCKKKNIASNATIPVNFEYNYPIVSPIITQVDTLLIFDTYEFPSNTDDVLKESNSNSDLLKEARLTYLSMKLTFPDTANFDFIKDIELYMYDKDLGETLGAYKYNVSSGLKFIQFDLTGEDIHEYLKKDLVQFRIKGVLRKPMESSIIILVQSKFSGRAGVL